jgi:hypothetical protein
VRSVLFWIHLTAGVVAGLVILLMSATGVLLTYEKQMLAWSDRTPAAAPPVAEAPRLPVEELLAACESRGTVRRVTGVTVSAVDGAPALVTIGQRTIAVNAYTGAVLGDASPQLRKFFPRRDRVAPMAWRRRTWPTGRARVHGVGQPPLSRRHPPRANPVDPTHMDRSTTAGRDALQGRSARQGSRLQLAQRHRHLVRRPADP